MKNFPQHNLEDKILEHTAQYDVPFTLTKEEALAKLKVKINAGAQVSDYKEKTKHYSLYWVSSAAAVAVLLIASWYLFIKEPVENVVCNKGQHNEYQLPDGSEVSLNAESKIAFIKGKFNKKRLLTLKGEAFFKVKKGKVFTIETDNADIRVLGTSFNVYARENLFKVACVTGKIMVSSGKQMVIITPGESVELINNKLNKNVVKDIENIASWRAGEFYYENAPLTSIFKEIERQYNVTFVLPNIENKYFTGSFTNKNLVNALDIVCIPMGFDYEIGSNSKIHISEKKQ